MNKLFSLAVAAGLLIATQMIPTANANNAGHKMGATGDRTTYLSTVETKLKSIDRQIIELKTQRDREASNTDRFKELDKQVSRMEDQSKEVREKVADLRKASSTDWASIQSDLEKEMAKLDRFASGYAD